MSDQNKEAVREVASEPEKCRNCFWAKCGTRGRSCKCPCHQLVRSKLKPEPKVCGRHIGNPCEVCEAGEAADFGKLKPEPTPTQKCPECDSTDNSQDLGGNEKCFHCGACGYVQCACNNPADPTPVRAAPNTLDVERAEKWLKDNNMRPSRWVAETLHDYALSTHHNPPVAPVDSGLDEFLSVCEGECAHPYCWSQKTPVAPVREAEEEEVTDEMDAYGPCEHCDGTGVAQPTMEPQELPPSRTYAQPYSICGVGIGESCIREKHKERMEGGDGWCSSCDRMHEVNRPLCPKCGDYLIFATDDESTVAGDLELALARAEKAEAMNAAKDIEIKANIQSIGVMEERIGRLKDALQEVWAGMGTSDRQVHSAAFGKEVRELLS